MCLRDSSKFVLFAAVLTVMFAGRSAASQTANGAGSTLSATTVPQAEQMQPAELDALLKAGTDRPLVLQVGSHVMFAQAHIRGSIYAGPGSQSTGLQALEKAVASAPKGRLIVIYCGCCPWNKCPNIGPAYKKLRDLGFTHVKALYIANNFGDDWVGKGYAIEKGE